MAEEKLKVQELCFTVADRTLQAVKLMSVSHTVSNLKGEAERVVDPQYRPPDPDPEDLLNPDEHDFFLDQRDTFYDVARAEGKSEAEINKLWESEKFTAIQNAKDTIL